MATEWSTPWRCKAYGLIHSAGASFCPQNGQPWQRCYDPTYVHVQTPRRPASASVHRQDQPNWNSTWDNQQQPQKPKKPKRPKGRKSPRQPKSPRNAGKEPEALAPPAKGKYPAEPAWNWPPPDKTGGPAPSNPPAEPPPAPGPNPSEIRLRKLMTLLSKEENLSAEIQSVVKDSETAVSQNATKEMHAAVTRMGLARKSVQELQSARLAFHLQWKAFLEDGVARWKAYVDDFNGQEQSFLAGLQKARDELRAAQEYLDATREKVTATGPVAETGEISDEDFDKTDVGVQGHAQMMVDTLSAMKQKLDESWQLDERQSKQARLENAS